MKPPEKLKRRDALFFQRPIISPPLAFPFTAIVGFELAKRALMLLAVDPKLKGVLIAAGGGTGKTTLARASFNIFLPPGEAEARNYCHPIVELPVGVTQDRLLGGLDVGLTLATGRPQLKSGLLAEAHGGILYADGINLLEKSTASHLGCALSDGQVAIEREGMSCIFPTEFLLIGTYDPAEGEVSASLRDRVGLVVEEAAELSASERAEVIGRVAGFSQDPVGFIEQYAVSMARLRAQIASARARLPEVQISLEDRRRLGVAALQLGVEGNRADIFALRTALASAALDGRSRVAEEDIEMAINLVLLPRALVIPRSGEEQENQMRATGGDPRATQSSSLEDEASEVRNPQRSTHSAQLFFPALSARLPEELLAVPRRLQRRSAIGSRGETFNRLRGRYVGSVAGGPAEGKIAIDATLRAAALSQVFRSRQPLDRRLAISAEDLRFKRFKQKAGMLFIFAVDASGSMALNRMSQAKGALVRLLKEAYLHRDKVALISFRGQKAEVLLPPCQSVERAKRSLDALPVGGGTPLAAGLVAALELARRARRMGIRQTMLVLFTDGRANVGLNTAITGPSVPQRIIWREIEQIGAAFRREAIASLVIDTQVRFTSRGEGKEIATLLGGRYIYLPQANVEKIYDSVVATASARSLPVRRVITTKQPV